MLDDVASEADIRTGLAKTERKTDRLIHAVCEAAKAMRALIKKIVLMPGKKRSEVKAELHGELAAILALTSGQKPRPVQDEV